jgi:hypothetical protein
MSEYETGGRGTRSMLAAEVSVYALTTRLDGPPRRGGRPRHRRNWVQRVAWITLGTSFPLEAYMLRTGAVRYRARKIYFRRGRRIRAGGHREKCCRTGTEMTTSGVAHGANDIGECD